MIPIPPYEVFKQAVVIALLYTIVENMFELFNLMPFAAAFNIPVNMATTFGSTMMLWFLMYWFGFK